MSRKKRRRFTPEQRAQAIRIVKESGKSIRQVAEELDVPPSSLGRAGRKGRPGTVVTSQPIPVPAG